MILNVEDVIRWLELQNIEWWTVSLTKDDNAKVFDSLDDETLEARKNRFRETMKLAPGNRFIIRGKANKQAGRGMFQEEFQNNIANQSTQSQQQTIGMVSGITPDEVEKRILDALSKAERERELKDLKEQNNQLQKALKEVDNVGTRFMQKLEPYIGMIASSVVSKLVPNTPAVTIASIAPNDQEETEIDQSDDDPNINDLDPVIKDEVTLRSERIENALIAWAKADPDYIDLLEAISHMAASSDPMYAMAKNFVKK